MKLHLSVIECVFPKYCLICGAFDTLLCQDCKACIVLQKKQRCSECFKPSAFGHTHDKCAKTYSLDGLLSASYYEQMSPLITAFKYSLVRNLSDDLAGLVLKFLFEQDIADYFENFVVTEVPLIPSKLRSRGFNQAGLLADFLSKSLDIKRESLLTKLRDTTPQAHLKLEERLTNAKNSFSLATDKSLKGEKILVVDDVSTTGATLRECGKVLKTAGAAEVWGLSLAHE